MKVFSNKYLFLRLKVGFVNRLYTEAKILHSLKKDQIITKIFNCRLEKPEERINIDIHRILRWPQPALRKPH